MQSIFDSFHFLRCRIFPGRFQFFYCIRSVIHRQAQTPLYLCYISGMYLEAIFSFYVFLYLFVCNSLFRLVRLGSLCDIIKRNFSLTPTILNFYVDIPSGFLWESKTTVSTVLSLSQQSSCVSLSPKYTGKRNFMCFRNLPSGCSCS